MASAFLKELLLTQLEKVGLRCGGHRPPPPPVVQQTLNEAGFCAEIPTNDIPVSALPGMLRLDKSSWLSCVSIEASFAPEVEDGDLVCPTLRTPSDEFRQNVAELGDAVWGHYKNSATLKGIAYVHIGRVLFGPLVKHPSFTFRTGDQLFAAKGGKLTTEKNDNFVGLCVAPGSILLK